MSPFAFDAVVNQQVVRTAFRTPQPFSVTGDHEVTALLMAREAERFHRPRCRETRRLRQDLSITQTRRFGFDDVGRFHTDHHRGEKPYQLPVFGQAQTQIAANWGCVRCIVREDIIARHIKQSWLTVKSVFDRKRKLGT